MYNKYFQHLCLQLLVWSLLHSCELVPAILKSMKAIYADKNEELTLGLLLQANVERQLVVARAAREASQVPGQHLDFANDKKVKMLRKNIADNNMNNSIAQEASQVPGQHFKLTNNKKSKNIADVYSINNIYWQKKPFSCILMIR